MNRFRTILALLTGSVLVAASMTACEVTDPGGNKWTVRPATRQPSGPNNGNKVGEFCDANGNCYDLIDTNGDGIPDFAVDKKDGRWYPIKPVNPGYEPPAQQPIPTNPTSPTGPTNPTGSSGPANPESPDGGGSDNPGAESPGGDPESPTPMPWWMAGIGDRIVTDGGWNAPAFNFGNLSAEAWIAAVGLDTTAGQLAETSAFNLNFFDTNTYHTEATIFWTGGFAMPNVLNFELDFVIDTLPSQQQGGVDFYVFRVRGNVREVIKLAMSMQDTTDPLSSFEFKEGAVIWSVVADAGTNTATLYADGVAIDAIDLD